MQASNAISPKLKEAENIAQFAERIKMRKVIKSDSEIAQFVGQIKSILDKSKEDKFTIELLQFYFHLIEALVDICFHYDSHSKNTTLLLSYAKLTESTLEYLFNHYKRDLAVLIAQKQRHLSSYYKLAVIYNIRSKITVWVKAAPSVSHNFIRISLHMFSYCNLPEQLALFSKDSITSLRVEFNRVILHFITTITEQLQLGQVSDKIDELNKCLNLLTPAVMDEFINIYQQIVISPALLEPTFRLIWDRCVSSIMLLMQLLINADHSKDFDEAFKIIAGLDALMLILEKFIRNQEIYNNFKVQLTHFKAHSYYQHGAFLLVIDQAENTITFDVLLRYIRDGSCDPIDNILSKFNQAKLVTTLQGFDYLDVADVYKNIFKKLREEFVAEVACSSNSQHILIDQVNLQKKVTNFLVSSANKAYENAQYKVAENLYFFSLHVLPIINERSRNNLFLYTLAAYMNIQYNLTRCYYKKCLEEKKKKPLNSNAAKMSNSIYLYIYLTVSDIWHTLQDVAGNLNKHHKWALKDYPALLAELDVVEQMMCNPYGMKRTMNINKLLQELSPEEKSNLNREFLFLNQGLMERLPKHLKNIYENLLTPEHQRIVKNNGLALFIEQEEKNIRQARCPSG